MVLHALLNKLERMREGLGREQVFDVVDQLLEGESLEQLIREALANRLTFEEVRDRVLARLDRNQAQRLEEATMTGLATRYVDLTRLQADRQRAAEARLIPAYIRAFFTQALNTLAPGRLERRDDGREAWRVTYVPAALRDVPEELRRNYGQPLESYPAISFDKEDLREHPHLTFIGPGQPLFEAIIHHVLVRFGPELARGAVLQDPLQGAEGLLWLLTGKVEDGLGRMAGQQLFALFQPWPDGEWRAVSPARLLDFEPPSTSRPLPESFHRQLAEVDQVVEWSLDHVLDPYLADLQARRTAETGIIRDYLRRSFDVLIAGSQGKLMEYEQKARRGIDMTLSLQEERRHLDDLRRRQSSRLAEVERAAVLSLAAPEIIGVAAIVSASSSSPPLAGGIRGGAEMRRSDEVEQAAMDYAMAYEQQRGWVVADVHTEGRGYDLLSRGPGGQVRYIEVKGRAATGAVELSANEWLKAEQLGGDYWLYVVTDATRSPSLHPVQDPAHRLAQEEVVPRVRYQVSQQGWHRAAESRMEYNINRQDAENAE
jgi:hypothetical protein